MKTIKLNNDCTVSLFDSIKEITIERYNEFKKLILQDVEIGSDMTSVGAHLANIFKFIDHAKYEEARQEAVNLHNNLFYAIEGIDIKSLCFIAYVAEINGKPYTSMKREEAEKTLKMLSKNGLTLEMVYSQVEDLKKKFLSNFEPSFLINTEIPPIEMPL